MISALVNMNYQLNILSDAYVINNNLASNISQLKNENQNLKERIKYATDSAYTNQQMRDELGVGESNDYWLVLPAEDKNIDLYPKMTTEEKFAPIKQWISLFTQ